MEDVRVEIFEVQAVKKEIKNVFRWNFGWGVVVETFGLSPDP